MQPQLPPVERVLADEVDRTRNVAPGALRQDQEHPLRHAFADQREEFPV